MYENPAGIVVMPWSIPLEIPPDVDCAVAAFMKWFAADTMNAFALASKYTQGLCGLRALKLNGANCTSPYVR